MMGIVRYVRVGGAGEEQWAQLDGNDAVYLDAAPWSGGRPTGKRAPRATVTLACPVAPRKIFAIGRNYPAHAVEMGGVVPTEPLVFAKAISSLIGPGDRVLLPEESTHVAYEGELGLVMGSRCRRVAAEHALEHVFGCVPVCDVTARDLQAKDGQWTRAKSFDTFCPAGPEVVRGVDPDDLDLCLRVNGVERQHARTSEMVFSAARIVAHVSSFATLEPGDLILTGTPEGVGPLSPGDAVDVTIEHLGSLSFRVARET